MQSRHLPSLATLFILLSTPPAAVAQANLPIYTDSLVNGFQDWSWATRNLSNTSPVHVGSRSVSVTTTAWTALSFYHFDFNTAPYSAVTFWAHGGTAGGQRLQVYVNYGSSGQGTTAALPSALTAGTWTQYTISLSSLGVANRTNVNRINIQLTASGTTNTFYLDDLSLTAAPAPALVHLSVNASQTARTAEARWFGLNTAIWDSNFDTSSTTNALKELGCQTLRFPGGSLSDFYHWATGARHDGYSFDPTRFSNFMHVATNSGVRTNVYITVNYGTGTSNEAAAWVRHANVTNQCGFKYWEIGNECYGSWESDTNTPAHDPYTYAVRSAGYIALMKAADPTIKIGVVATPGEGSYSNNATHYAVNPRTGTTNYGWTPVMLATLKSLGVTPDYLVHHVYPEYTGSESDPLVLQSAVTWAADAADLRQQITDYVGTGGTNIELVCTENNSNSGNQGRQSTSIVNGLYLADSLSQLMKTEFNAFVWWDLRNGTDTSGSFDPTLYGWRTYGDLGIMSGATNKYPTFYALKLMQYLARHGDTVLKPTSDYLLLSAYAALKTNGTLALLVINKDSTTNLTAQISIAGFTPSATATVRSYGIQQDEATRTNGPAALKDLQTNSVTVGALFTNTFPPYSLTLFTFTPGGAAPVATTLSLVSGANPSTYGNTVTFTATVRTNGVAVGNISGQTITFYNGAAQMGTGTLNASGQAAYTTTATLLAAGTRSITAGYAGNASYLGSTNSPALSQTVNPATLTAGLTGTVSRSYNGTTAATLASGNYTLAGVFGGDTVTLNNPTSGTYDNRNFGTGKTVNVTGLSISGASAANYILSSTSASGPVGTISRTNITVTATANSRTYDGTTAAAATPAITAGSIQTGDTASFTESYATRTVGTGKTLVPAGAVNDSNGGNNYTVTFVNNTAGVISARPLTVTASGVDKVYDGTAAATATLADDRVAGDVLATAYTNASFSSKHVGTGKTVSVSGISISGADAANYTANTTAAATADISARAVTVTAAANAKTYDGTLSAAATPTITSGVLQTGDTAGFAETYDTRNVGTGKTLTPSGVVNDGNGGNNYSYTFAPSANGTITAATLTYVADLAAMTYGSALPGLSGSVTGFAGGDTLGNATTGTLDFTTPATPTSGAGSYAIDGGGLTALNGNYTFVQAAANATALTVNPLPVSLTGARPYDATTLVASGILSVANRIGSDDVTVASGTGTVASPNVGLQSITSFGTLTLGGTAAGNYTLLGATGSVTITAAGLTVSVTNLLAVDKVYDASTNATLDASGAGLDGVLGSDDVALVSSNAYGYFADKNAGTNKPVTVIGLALQGVSATNYVLVDPTNVTASITPAALAVSGVVVASKVYDGTVAATLNGSPTLVGGMAGDNVSLLSSGATASFADPAVGANKSVIVAGYSLTGSDAINYTLAQPTELTADILPLVVPVFASQGIARGSGAWDLTFDAQPGQSYRVLAADDLALPISSWTVLTNGVFGAGPATYTDSSGHQPNRFYRIVSP